MVIYELWIAFVLSLFFGFLTWIAKYKWNDKTKTQLFGLLAVIFTIIFMILVCEKLP